MLSLDLCSRKFEDRPLYRLHLIHQLDQMAMTLLKVSSTHPEGVKINRVAVTLSRAKRKLLQDFVQGIDIVSQLSEKAKGERYF